MYKRNLNVRLDRELEDLLDELRSNSDINISSMVRKILKEELRNYLREIIDNIGGIQIHE